MTAPHILIIDDNQHNILVLEQLLRMEDIQSRRLASTNQLEAKLDEFREVDIVFLDLEMPALNGYEALTVLRDHLVTKNAKIIAYSVHTSQVSTAMARGFDGFLGKPLDAEAFPQQLEKILNGETIRYIP
ncbi:MAG: response regulator [Chloroflexota bacterium]